MANSPSRTRASIMRSVIGGSEMGNSTGSRPDPRMDSRRSDYAAIIAPWPGGLLPGMTRSKRFGAAIRAIRRRGGRVIDWCLPGFCPGMPGFWGFCSFFLLRRDDRVVGRCGFGGLRGGGAGFSGWFGGGVLSGFAQIFGFLDGCGRLEGCYSVSALDPLHGLADGLGGWLGLLASFFLVVVFQIQRILKK